MDEQAGGKILSTLACHLVCIYVQAKARSRDQWGFSSVEEASG